MYCYRHPFPGPGLAIRVICADEPYMCSDFSLTQTMLRIIASYSHSINKPHAFLQVSFLVLVIIFSPVNFSLLGMRYFMENLRTIAFVDSD